MSKRLASVFDQIAYWQPSARWVRFWSSAGTLLWNQHERRSRC